MVDRGEEAPQAGPLGPVPGDPLPHRLLGGAGGDVGIGAALAPAVRAGHDGGHGDPSAVTATEGDGDGVAGPPGDGWSPPASRNATTARRSSGDRGCGGMWFPGLRVWESEIQPER